MMFSVISIVSLCVAVAVFLVTITVKKRKRKVNEKKSREMVTDSKVQKSAAPRYPDESVLVELYARLESYFAEQKPYLDGNLTLMEVSRAVYTNKAYMSRALKNCGGKNFCQFVNEYRIKYAIELLKEGKGLRINEVAQRSGFNSMATFNISFRAYAGVSPSDWCKEYRRKRFSQENLD